MAVEQNILNAARRPDGTLDQDKYYQLLRIQRGTKNVDETLAQAQNIASTKPGTPQRVQVRSGDTLESIANRYAFEGQGVALLDAIARANGLYFSDGVLNQNVTVGSYLNIPGSFRPGQGVNLGGGGSASGISGGVSGTDPQTGLSTQASPNLDKTTLASFGVPQDMTTNRQNLSVAALTGANNAVGVQQVDTQALSEIFQNNPTIQRPQNRLTPGNPGQRTSSFGEVPQYDRGIIGSIFTGQGTPGQRTSSLAGDTIGSQISSDPLNRSGSLGNQLAANRQRAITDLYSSPATNPAVSGTPGQSSAGQLADAARYTAMAVEASIATGNRAYMPDELSPEMVSTLGDMFEIDGRPLADPEVLDALGYKFEGNKWQRYDEVVSTGGYSGYGAYSTRAYSPSSSRSSRRGSGGGSGGSSGYAYSGYSPNGLTNWRIDFG